MNIVLLFLLFLHLGLDLSFMCLSTCVFVLCHNKGIHPGLAEAAPLFIHCSSYEDAAAG